MKKCTERPRVLCSLNGAVDVVGNIYQGIPILHAGPGCSMQAAVATNLYYLGGYHGMPSTNTYEKEVVFGGTDRLRETIRGSLEVMDGRFYAVLTGCSMGINGDDVESVVREFEDSPYPVISVDVAGFRGDTYLGYQATLLAILKKMARKTQTNPKLVNLYGQVPSMDMTFRGDLEELTRLLERLGLQVNTFFIRRDGVDQIINSGNAALNINLSPWMCRNIDSYYEKEFGIPTLHYPGMPIGPTASTDFMRRVAAQLDLDREKVERVITEEEQYVFEYFDSLMGNFERQRFILVGESNFALGIARFLVNDHGYIPLAVILTDSAPRGKQKEIEEELRNLECGRKPDVYFEDDVYRIEQIAKQYRERMTMFLGSSFEKEAASRFGVFFVTATAPCLDKQILNRSHVGTRGCLALMEDMYNHY